MDSLAVQPSEELLLAGREVDAKLAVLDSVLRCRIADGPPSLPHSYQTRATGSPASTSAFRQPRWYRPVSRW